VRYLSPELLQGTAPTPQSDLWGLGCVLFEAATGRPIHTGAPAQTMISILRTHPLDMPAAEGLHPGLKNIFRVIFEPDHHKRISDGYELSEMFQRFEAELNGGEETLSLAVIDAVAARPAASEELVLPSGFEHLREDNAAAEPAAPAAPTAPLSSAAPDSPSFTPPTASGPMPVAPPNPASGPMPVVPSHPGSGAMRAVPATPFNTPKPGSIASGAFPTAPGPAGTPHRGVPAPSFGGLAGPSSGLFELPGDGTASGPMPIAPPAVVPPPAGANLPTGGYAPPPPGVETSAPLPEPPSTNPTPFVGAPNPYGAAADDLEVDAREPGQSRLLRTTGTQNTGSQPSRSGPSPFAGIGGKFVKGVLLLLAIGLAWRFAIQPAMEKKGIGGDTQEVQTTTGLDGAGSDGPTYEEMEKERLLAAQRRRLKNVPGCWKGDSGYKFVYTRGGRNVVVQTIKDVPVRFRKKARCISTQ